jgi:hypothetical protein
VLGRGRDLRPAGYFGNRERGFYKGSGEAVFDRRIDDLLARLERIGALNGSNWSFIAIFIVLFLRFIGVGCNIKEQRGFFRENVTAYLRIERIEISEVESRLNTLAHTLSQSRRGPNNYPLRAKGMQ